jgi:TonB family protein
MAMGTQSGGWTGPSRRRVPRYQMLGALNVTVLRSGIPDTVPGRALNLGERGIAAVLAGELKPGESVGVELQLSATKGLLRTRATVRYHDNLRYGLEFTAMSPEQRLAILEWAKEAKVEADLKENSVSLLISKPETEAQSGSQRIRGSGGESPRIPKRTRRRSRRWLVAGIIAALLAGASWWKWNRSWDQLEAGLKTSETVAGEKPQAQVPAEVMQKLLVHRVEPVYPAEARKQRLQGVVALDIVVGRDGSVVSMRALNGPDLLAQAAMDALRWWKFEPYRLNGEPAVVETTLAVEFKR